MGWHIHARDLLAVAAGDETLSTITDYSIWSSGTLGNNKQKSHVNYDGYSTKVYGGTIGLELSLKNDLLLGASFSKFSSRVKQQSKSASIATRYDTQSLSPVSRNMSLSAIGSAGQSKGAKSHSKLLSFEQHLHYKISLPQHITLIPNIGFKYEYERSKACKEQIAGNLSIERGGKKSYQAINTEIGSRVIFAPIKLDANGTSNVTLSNTTPSTILVTPTAHFLVERRIGSRGASSPYHLTYQGNGGIGQEIGASTTYINLQHQKTSLNAGIGLIASHKNIKLELLYEHTRQKRFKSHQGVLKLKVSF